MTQHRTIQERGYCTSAGYRRIDRVLNQFCELENGALQERREAWKMCHERISYQNQVGVPSRTWKEGEPN